MSELRFFNETTAETAAETTAAPEAVKLTRREKLLAQYNTTSTDYSAAASAATATGSFSLLPFTTAMSASKPEPYVTL